MFKTPAIDFLPILYKAKQVYANLKRLNGRKNGRLTCTGKNCNIFVIFGEQLIDTGQILSIILKMQSKNVCLSNYRGYTTLIRLWHIYVNYSK